METSDASDMVPISFLKDGRWMVNPEWLSAPYEMALITAEPGTSFRTRSAPSPSL